MRWRDGKREICERDNLSKKRRKKERECGREEERNGVKTKVGREEVRQWGGEKMRAGGEDSGDGKEIVKERKLSLCISSAQGWSVETFNLLTFPRRFAILQLISHHTAINAFLVNNLMTFCSPTQAALTLSPSAYIATWHVRIVPKTRVASSQKRKQPRREETMPIEMPITEMKVEGKTETPLPLARLRIYLVVAGLRN